MHRSARFSVAGAWLIRWAAILPSLLFAFAAAAQGPDESASQPFRLAFSSSMFTEVNEGDARAAMKVWIMTLGKERGLPVDPDPHICRSLDELVRLGRDLQIDAFGFSTTELPFLTRHFSFDRVALSSTHGKVTEEYVVLVHSASTSTNLANLAGKSLNILQSPRMSMGPVWLETELLAAGLGRMSNFFGRVTTLSKASAVVLQVFFRQADACIVNRNAFAILGELNPQLSKQLKVIAASPGLVPSVFGFRADRSTPLRNQIMAEMAEMAKSPAGRQILTLTQSDGVDGYPASQLDDTVAMLAKHEELCAAAAQAQPKKPEGPDP